MKISVLLTAYKEADSIKKAIKQILYPNQNLWHDLELIVCAPDTETLDSALAEIKLLKFNNYKIIRDQAAGKASALNLSHEKANGEILILTDGDMYIGDNSIRSLLYHFSDPEVGGVSGHPVSLENRNSAFGYFSHLFCEAAHQKRLRDPSTHMSGYLYAFRNFKEIFPLPAELKAEDAYISYAIKALGYKTVYEPSALAYVRFPKNYFDWIRQKTRSLGGTIQVSKFNAQLPQIKRKRSVFEDISMLYFPLKFAGNTKELVYSLFLYPIRLHLWLNIYFRHVFNLYSKGAWQRIESSKH